MELSERQIKLLEQELDDAWTYIGASMQTKKAFYVLKGITDEIKQHGYDEYYDLNKHGLILQQLYEEIYAANINEFE